MTQPDGSHVDGGEHALQEVSSSKKYPQVGFWILLPKPSNIPFSEKSSTLYVSRSRPLSHAIWSITLDFSTHDLATPFSKMLVYSNILLGCQFDIQPISF